MDPHTSRVQAVAMERRRKGHGHGEDGSGNGCNVMGGELCLLEDWEAEV